MSDGKAFNELKTRVVRTILARRITLGVFSAVALVVKFTTRISYLNPLFYAPLVWFGITFPFQYLIVRQSKERSLHLVHACFFVVEIAIITVFIHLMGGSEWIGIVFYLFTVIYANFFLPRLLGYAVTGLVVLLYSSLVILEYVGVLPHRSLFAVFGDPYRSLSYNLTTILAGAVGIYVVLAYTVRSFTEIYERKNLALARRQSELTQLSSQLLYAQDEERRRIAHQLHDGLSQSLAAVKLRIGALGERLDNEDRNEIAAIVDQAISDTRSLAYSLRPPLLDDLGLVPSLYRFAETVERASGLVVALDVEEIERLSPGVESLLFYVTQESVRNVQKHARAKRVTVSLARSLGLVVLSVQDDGVGFAPSDSRGLGLRGIEERVEIAGGKTVIDSSPGRGTLICVEIPCDVD